MKDVKTNGVPWFAVVSFITEKPFGCIQQWQAHSSRYHRPLRCQSQKSACLPTIWKGGADTNRDHINHARLYRFQASDCLSMVRLG
jgi:hypothetical protein